jgi:hypothetical protein
MLPLLLLLACGDETKNQDTALISADTGTTQDTETEVVPWYPTGSGRAYYLDGLISNSLLVIEMNLITPPPEGDMLVAFLMGDGLEDIYAGPLPTDGTVLSWQSEVNRDALIEGYDRMEIRLQNRGDIGYSGGIDPVVYSTYGTLLLESPDSLSGKGLLREMQQIIQTIYATQESMVAVTGDTSTQDSQAEGVLNTIFGQGTDYNTDGTIDVLPDTMPLIGQNFADTADLSNLRNLILRDLTLASAAAHEISPLHPIKDLANVAYDCTQMIGTHIRTAAQETDNVALRQVTEEADIDARLTQSNVYLTHALEGFDTNEDGTLDDGTEGALRCTLEQVAQMAIMEITVQ